MHGPHQERRRNRRAGIMQSQRDRIEELEAKLKASEDQSLHDRAELEAEVEAKLRASEEQLLRDRKEAEVDRDRERKLILEAERQKLHRSHQTMVAKSERNFEVMRDDYRKFAQRQEDERAKVVDRKQEEISSLHAALSDAQDSREKTERQLDAKKAESHELQKALRDLVPAQVLSDYRSGKKPDDSASGGSDPKGWRKGRGGRGRS